MCSILIEQLIFLPLNWSPTQHLNMISYCEKTDNYGLVWRVPPVIEFNGENEKKMQMKCMLCNTQPSREKRKTKKLLN